MKPQLSPITDGGSVTLPGRIEAENYDTGGENISQQPTEDGTGDRNIGWIDDGEWVGYEVAPEPGVYTLALRLASPNDGRQIEVSFEGEVLATVDVPNTGGWQTWETIEVPDLELPGDGELRLTFIDGEFNVNFLEFERTGDLPGEEPGPPTDGEGNDLKTGYGSGGPIDDVIGELKDRINALESESDSGDSETRRSDRETYAADFPGDDLSAKVRNAIDELSNGKGRVRITPREDGDPWQWTDTLELNCVELGGAELDIDDNCEIEYDVDGFAIVVNNTPSTNNHPGQESRLLLTGGLWDDIGNPDGWLQIKDSIGCHIVPNEVRCYNEAGDATAVSIENHASYSESTHVAGRFGADRGIDFVPQSITGGSGGTDSFHDTYLENCHINARDFGMRFRGRFMYCTITNPSLFCKADGARGMVMESGRMDGTTILGPKFESPGNFANTLGIETGGDFSGWYGPTIFGGYVGYGMDGWHEGQGELSWLYHRQAGLKNDTKGRQDNFVVHNSDGDPYRIEVDGDGNLEASGL